LNGFANGKRQMAKGRALEIWPFATCTAFHHAGAHMKSNVPAIRVDLSWIMEGISDAAKEMANGKSQTI